VCREAQEFHILHQSSTVRAIIARDHGFHLVEEQLLGHAAEECKRLLEPGEQRLHRLSLVEPEPQEARVTQDDQ